MQSSYSGQATKPGNLFILPVILWFSTSMCFANQTSTPDNFSSSPIAPQSSPVVAEICLIARQGYVSQLAGQCDGKFSIWR